MSCSIGMFILSGLVLLPWPGYCDLPSLIGRNPCPKSCTCKLPWFMNGAFVNCSAQGFSTPPVNLPQNTVELDLSGNSLVKVPYLKSLYRLKKLDIAHNKLKDQGVQSIGDGMCNLEELKLARNQLSRFPVGLPKSLIHLDLSENIINTLTCSLLSALPPVKNLILSKNMLTVLTKDSFCPNFGTSPPLSAVLRNLDLSGNNIHFLEEGVFRCLTKLERLNLSGNLLSIVGPKEFKGLTTLKVLDLSNNALLQVGEGSFYDMNDLHYLVLKRNQLTSIPRSLQPTIHVLDVSSNAIAVIAEDSALFAIKHIIIGHNPLICDCRIRWIRQHLIDSIPVSLKDEDCPIDIPIPSNILLEKDLAPRCSNPTSLAGKTLDQITDDKLVCCVNNNHSCGTGTKNKKHLSCLTQRPINRSPTIPPHTSSKSIAEIFQYKNCECPNLPENPWAHIRHNNRTSLIVEWTIPSALEGTTVEVQFYIFGFRNCKISKKVPISNQQVILSDLKSDTNYVVCVMPTHCANTETPILLDSCFEVRTDSLPLFHRLTNTLLGNCSCNMRLICTVIFILIIVGLILMLGEMKHLLMRATVLPGT